MRIFTVNRESESSPKQQNQPASRVSGPQAHPTTQPSPSSNPLRGRISTYSLAALIAFAASVPAVWSSGPR